MSKAKVISIINMKGGVGKTSVCINLGHSLSLDGFKTLIIDTDPQFNATQSLLLYKTKEDNSRRSLDESEKLSADFYTGLSKERKTIMQIYDPSFATSPLDNPSLVLNIKDNLDLIPGDLRLASTIAGDTSNKVAILEKHIEDNELDSYYDYIIIDCPPTWTILTHSALYASNYYLIPSKIDLYSSLGIQLLEEQIFSKITDDTMYIKTQKKLYNLGLLFTMVKNNNTVTQRKKDIQKSFKPNLDFFDVEIPDFPSATTRYLLYEEVRGQSNYDALTNSLDKLVQEFKSKIKKLEESSDE